LIALQQRRVIFRFKFQTAKYLKSVIASEAKQSSFSRGETESWIASSLRSSQ
jgi:hypothetical protein